MKIEDYLLEVISKGEDVLLECSSPADRESKRTQAFIAKRKLGELVSGVSISRLESEGMSFVKLSKRPAATAWKYDQSGKLVRMEG